MRSISNFFLNFILIFFVGCSNKQPTFVLPPPPTPQAQAKEDSFKYTFEELQSVASYLTTLTVKRINDQFDHKKSNPILKCDPEEKYTDMWLMQIKARIDEQIPTEQKKFLSSEKYLDKFKTCEKLCICGDYAEMIQTIEDRNIQIKYKNDIDNLRKKHKTMTDQQSLACAKSLKKFCSSELHTYLKSLHF